MRSNITISGVFAHAHLAEAEHSIFRMTLACPGLLLHLENFKIYDKFRKQLYFLKSSF